MLKDSRNIMHEQVVIPGGSPIRVKWNDFPHFTFPWHFHSEYEIVYILKSHGTRFIADSLAPFEEGDLVLVGSQVPHYWKNDKAFYDESTALRVNAIVVQFSGDFMRQAILDYPEMGHIKELLNRSSQGIHFSLSFARRYDGLIKALFQNKGFSRLLKLLELLDGMARTKEYCLLGSPDFDQQMPEIRDHRLNKVLNYISLNYTQKMVVSELAFKFGMNAAAFSRFFKSKTGKTPVEYINDMRINYACKLLQNGDLSVSQTCFECGFNNLSNFNRIFKGKMNMTPKEYLVQLGGW
ncbi:AraC family transcriptional regulator [Geofilum sp. OHC36d9]|uniref:AraC family transcriptional regulator n=1 Tax=Geofilum sp. OHC36d9 TaxID=3458413 RepID=UPI0040340D94